MENSVIFKKVYGALIGSAIGDAMGGPVEGFSFSKIERDYGFVKSLLPYTEIEIAVHGPFEKMAGAYTDDSRMSKIFAQAIIEKGGVANSKDIAKAYIDYYHAAQNELEKGFMEEYYYKAIYGENKEVFGGQPTNGAIMGIAPYGVISPCNPYKSLCDAFEALFMVGGYARYASAMAAAAISSAMKPDADYTTVIIDMFDAVQRHKQQVEGSRWAQCHMYPYVGRKSEKLTEDGMDAVSRHINFNAARQDLSDAVVQEFFADGAESLAIATSLFHMAKGDFTDTVTYCVNFGRDNDSSASIGGALAGALNGIDAIPHEWVEQVEQVNPSPTFKELALKICNIIKENNCQTFEVASHVNSML